MALPARPKIYHIVHIDRLPSILADGRLVPYASVKARGEIGTSIGMRHIKERRLGLPLDSQPGLLVGSCVPFYFCSRSVMLYMIARRNAGLEWQGGQDMVVHLEADLLDTVAWAAQAQRRWAFTLSNAASGYFEDRASLDCLGELNWAAIEATDWAACRSEKRAEFLLEGGFPWHLVERIGVRTDATGRAVISACAGAQHRPPVNVISDWYYR